MIKTKINRIDVSNVKGNELELIMFGDWHIGSRDCDLDKIKKDIEYIENKDNTRVVLMGDLLDSGLSNSPGAGTFDNDMTPEQQYYMVLDLLKPIKDKIISVLIGNHCQRLINITSLNLMKSLARELNTNYLGYSGFHYVRFGKQTYTLFTTHGSAGSTTPAGKMSSCLNLQNYINVDIYCMGHVHDTSCYEKEIFEVSLKDKMVEKNKKYFVLSGHYLKYGGYAQQKHYAPGKTGNAKVILRGDRREVKVLT